MPVNDFLPHATGVGANVVSPATWSASASRSTGFQNGVADPALANTALRQGTTISSMIAQFMADTLVQNIIDDGNIATLESQFISSIRLSVGSIPQAAQLHFGRDTGTANAMTVPAAPAVTVYVDGLILATIPNAANTTTTPTLSANGLAAVIIVNGDGTAVAAGDISTNTYVGFMYDSVLARWRIVSRVSLSQIAIMHRGADSGTKNAMSLSTTSPSISSVTDGTHITIKKGVTSNDAALTLAVAGTTAPVTWGDGTAFTGGEWVANADGLVVYDSASPAKFRLLGATSPFAFVIPGTKAPLLGARTYYVNASAPGSDSNDGLTSPTAFASVVKALNVAATFNQNGFDITINVANGTYSSFVCQTINGQGSIFIIGNETTPGSVIISTSAGEAITVNGQNYTIKGMTVLSSGSGAAPHVGAGLRVNASAQVVTRNIIFGACVDSHTLIGNGGILAFSGTDNGDATGYVSITGDSPFFLNVQGGGLVTLNNTILNTTGARTFASSFVQAADQGIIRGSFSTINLGSTVTGKRYNVTTLGLINTATANINYFPGTIAGTATLGGIYN